MIKIGAICPHPPIAVPEVGRGEDREVAATQDAMSEVGRRIAESGADTLIIISPHIPVMRDAILLNVSNPLTGGLAQFNAPGVYFEIESDRELAQEIQARANEAGLKTLFVGDRRSRKVELDHGVTVPLYFLRKAGVDLPLLTVSINFWELDRLYHYGKVITNAAKKIGRKIAVVASSDLSHRLLPSAPAGYDVRGKEFDAEYKRIVEDMDAHGILNIDPELVERAGQCGLRPTVMLFGALDGHEVESEVLSYEGPFGVGYLVAELKPGR